MKKTMAQEDTMDERTKVLISLGAATAANCVPCFQHYFGKATSVGLTHEEIEEAVDLASQVKKGAHMAMRNSIREVMGKKSSHELPCSGQANRPCCG
jgi:alkylhydroperoxidase/carboxymuconolactone decarboxylase family protein YurZ